MFQFFYTQLIVKRISRFSGRQKPSGEDAEQPHLRVPHHRPEINQLHIPDQPVTGGRVFVLHHNAHRCAQEVALVFIRNFIPRSWEWSWNFQVGLLHRYYSFYTAKQYSLTIIRYLNWYFFMFIKSLVEKNPK